MRALVIAALVACSGPPKPVIPPPPEGPPPIDLVESQPVETSLDSDLPDAYVVWLEMINGAERSLDFAEFYAANAPNSRLEPIVAAIEAAIARGVKVRFLAEISFVREYHDTIDRLQKAGAAIRTMDMSTSTGGILHAKYFIVDGTTAYLGSQNFDYRSLEHTSELGARIREPTVVRDLARLFGYDWAEVGGKEEVSAWLTTGTESEGTRQAGMRNPYGPISIVASPKGLLPQGIRWDLPELVASIGTANRSVRVQMMTYSAGDAEHPWTELEQPLLDAAARGAKVEILLADWSKRETTLAGLQRLARTPNVEIRFVTIPEHSSGFIPFARVVHAKLLVVDRELAWIGTSNWEREYFYESRNVGLIIGNPTFAERIAKWSDATWTSSYATRVDPDAKYAPPRIK